MIDTTVMLGRGNVHGHRIVFGVSDPICPFQAMNSGNVTIQINDDPSKAIEVPAGGKTLADIGVEVTFLNSIARWWWYRSTSLAASPMAAAVF